MGIRVDFGSIKAPVKQNNTKFAAGENKNYINYPTGSIDTFEYSSKTHTVKKSGILERIFGKKSSSSATTQETLEQFLKNETYLNMKLTIDKEQMENFLSSKDSEKGVKYENSSKSDKSQVVFKADKVLVSNKTAARRGRNFGELTEVLGTPMIIRGFKVYKDGFENTGKKYTAGTKTADNITVFKQDRYGRITGATVYTNVRFDDNVYPLRGKNSIPAEANTHSYCRLHADEVYETDSINPLNYYIDYEQSANTDSIAESGNDVYKTTAASVINFQTDNSANIYTAYAKNGNIVKFEKAQEYTNIK